AGGAVAGDIAELFQCVAGASQAAEQVGQKFASASTPLSRSLLQADLKRARGRLSDALEALLDLQARAEEELQALSGGVTDNRIADLQRLYARISYLTRWIGELEEKRARLSTC
ncbi:MAG: hypothetical protein ABIR71_03870, partial [Chthoniobacterales bacterium]